MPPVPIVGSWMVWQVMAAWCSKVQVKLWSREGTALPPPCCPHTPCCLLYPGGTHSSYHIMGNNDAKREAWMDETNYRDNRQQADCAPFPWGWKYELHIHELAQGPSTQLSMGKRTAKQTGSKNGWRRKKHMSTIHQAVNCALLCGWDTALWGHLSTMNPITVVCTIGQSVWNHRLHLRTRA